MTAETNAASRRGRRAENSAAGLSPRAVKTIRRLSVATVVILAISAAVLSYAGLYELGLRAGIRSELAILVPIMADGLQLVGSLGVVYAVLSGLRAGYPWFLVFLGVSMSVAGNWLASPPDLVSQVVHAAPPVVLALALEQLLRVFRHHAMQTPTKASGRAVEAPTHRTRLDEVAANLAVAPVSDPGPAPVAEVAAPPPSPEPSPVPVVEPITQPVAVHQTRPVPTREPQPATEPAPPTENARVATPPVDTPAEVARAHEPVIPHRPVEVKVESSHAPEGTVLQADAVPASTPATAAEPVAERPAAAEARAHAPAQADPRPALPVHLESRGDAPAAPEPAPAAEPETVPAPAPVAPAAGEGIDEDRTYTQADLGLAPDATVKEMVAEVLRRDPDMKGATVARVLGKDAGWVRGLIRQIKAESEEVEVKPQPVVEEPQPEPAAGAKGWVPERTETVPVAPSAAARAMDDGIDPFADPAPRRVRDEEPALTH